ncbi:MAG: M48 family metalloprotease [Terriglobales bacterium]
MRPRSFSKRVLAVALAILLVAPQVLEARYQPKPGWNLFSREQEAQIGKETSAEVEKKLPILKDSDPVTRYVQHLGAQLAEHAPGPKYPYTFKVVNQKEINAFALPGGPIYVNLGTIQAADNEAQLAGVMSHEISHVVMRHATAAASKQALAQAPLTILGGLMGKGIGGQLAQLGISFGVGSYFLRNSRKAESEADLVGADIMYDSGYDPHAMAAFFQKLEKEGGKGGPEFFSDHPNPGNRAATVSKEVATLPSKKFQTDSAEFRSIKSTVAGMKPPTAQEIAAQQQQAGGTMSSAPASEIAPSSTYKSLEHDAYRITYPENWQVFGDNTSAVTIAPKAGISENALAYGVIINAYQPEGRAALDDATHQLMRALQQSDANLKAVGHDEDIRVNGVPGKSVDFVNVSPIRSESGGTQRERDWLVTLQRKDGSLLYLVFVSTEKDFDQMRPAFEKMLRSLRLK